jgi:hypothetical protein
MPVNPPWTRRTFLTGSAAALAVPTLAGPGIAGGILEPVAREIINKNLVTRLKAAPKLFCIAYIEPSIRDQSGQEATIARFPLVIVPQDNLSHHRAWRKRIKELNPDIVMLVYHQSNTQVTLRGPGHDRMRALGDEGLLLTRSGRPLSVRIGQRTTQVYDPRSDAWQAAHLEASQLAIQSDDYDGLFMDNFTVFSSAILTSAPLSAQLAALQDVTARMRALWPDKLLVANSRYRFDELNGEMCENRPRDWASQLAPHEGHWQPHLNLANVLLPADTDPARIGSLMTEVHSLGGWFAASTNYQHVFWPDVFDTASMRRRIDPSITQP